MLVRFHERLRRERDESGSTLVVVLVVMLALSIAGLTLAAIVTSTSGMLVSSRSTAESRAAADAGLAEGVAKARRTGEFCSISASSTSPKYSVSSTCADGKVTFVSQGSGSSSGTTKTQAVYEYTPASDPGMGADLTFWGNATFTNEVNTGNILSVAFPSGNLTCQVHIPATIRLAGDFKGNGNCTIDGDVHAGGTVNTSNGPDTIKGNAIAAGPGKNDYAGGVNGDFIAAGPIEFSWSSRTIGGNVVSGGNVTLNRTYVTGSLTLPTSSTLEVKQGRVDGGVVRQATPAKPAAPVFDAWYDYAFSAADWPGYQVKTLAASGDGSWTCNRFLNNNDKTEQAKGWRDLADLTTPTVLDARACGELSSNNGSNPVVSLKTNVVMLAKSFDLTQLTIKSAAGYSPRLWVVVPDTNDNDQPISSPKCNNKGEGVILINNTNLSVPSMAYTPGCVNVAGGGSWTGTMYGGGFNYGGVIQFTGSSMALPGFPGSTGGTSSGSATLGTLVSQRDIP